MQRILRDVVRVRHTLLHTSRTTLFCSYQQRALFSSDISSSQADQNANFKQGDWMCPQCNSHVFASRNACFKCQEPKPGSNNIDDNHRNDPFEHKFREGDWICSCNAHNFARNRYCYQCNSMRPSDIQETHYDAQHDSPTNWKCIGCGYSNWGRRVTCRNCNEDRSKTSEWMSKHDSKLPENFKLGDWICSTCDVFNYARNTACRKCKGARDRPSEDKDDSWSHPLRRYKRSLPGWWCRDSHCHAHNPGEMDTCHACGRVRENPRFPEQAQQKSTFQESIARMQRAEEERAAMHHQSQHE